MDIKKQTVFVVDDDQAVRQSLSMLVKTVGLDVQTYNSAEAFLDAFEPAQAGCLVVDVRMPGMSGLELQSKLKARRCDIPVIIITGHGDVPMAIEALKAGAVDFIEKPFRDQVLLDAIQNAIRLDAARRSKQTGRAEIEAKLAMLTPREKQITELLAVGKSNKEIAYELGISQKTVDFHRAHVLEKLEVDSVVQLLRVLQKLDVS